jgi:hypothetical protein
MRLSESTFWTHAETARSRWHGIQLKSLRWTHEPYCLAIDKGISHFGVRRFDDAPKRRPRNTHAFGGFFLVEPFQVRQSQCFNFIRFQDDLYRVREVIPIRLEISSFRQPPYPSSKTGSWHLLSFPRLNYEHMLINVNQPPVALSGRSQSP